MQRKCKIHKSCVIRGRDIKYCCPGSRSIGTEDHEEQFMTFCVVKLIRPINQRVSIFFFNLMDRMAVFDIVHPCIMWGLPLLSHDYDRRAGVVIREYNTLSIKKNHSLVTHGVET